MTRAEAAEPGPDEVPLDRARLAAPPTRWLARELELYESIDSTNRVASERARAGAAHGHAVLAEAQTAGRGRLGRSFFSPPRQNLYASFVLRPGLTPEQAPGTVLAAGLAVAECVAETLGTREPVEIKWPNDVLLDGRKTSGILVEMSARDGRVDFLVLGVGVNLNLPRAAFPPELRERATSLAAWSGRELDRTAFALRLFGTLEPVLDLHAERGLAALRPRLDAFFRMGGARVRVGEPGGRGFEGRVLGVDEDGALRLLDASGAEQRVLAGDVTVLSREPAAAGAEPPR